MSQSVRQIAGTGNGRQNFKLFPSNASAKNEFRHAGSPVLQFAIPNGELMLDLSTIRVCGKVKYENVSASGANVRMDQYAGISSLFSTITWSSLLSRSVIEQINHYPQMVNTIVPALNNSQDFMMSLQSQNLSTQELEFQKNEFNATACTDDGVAFSTPIWTGMTMGDSTRIPLSKIGGLILSIVLSPDESFFINSTPADSPTWCLFDMSLEGDFYAPTPEERELLFGMKEGSIQVNTMTSLFNVVQASDHVSNFQLGMREVVAAFYASKPASWTNNYTQNEFQHVRILNSAQLTKQQIKVNYLKSGSLNPANFDILIEEGSNEGQAQEFYLASLRRLADMNNISFSNDTNDPRFAIGGTSFPATTTNQMLALNKENYVNAMAYDVLGDGSGSNFVQAPLTITIKTPLADGEVNALYVFILAKTIIEYDEMGIRVIT
jgi:hypothetical protein